MEFSGGYPAPAGAEQGAQGGQRLYRLVCALCGRERLTDAEIERIAAYISACRAQEGGR